MSACTPRTRHSHASRRSAAARSPASSSCAGALHTVLALARRTLLWSDSPHLETDLRLPSRSVLADLSRTSDSFSNMVAEAATAQVGNTDADLKRVKYAVTNLKGGVQELDAHARFLEGARLAGGGAAHMNARHSCVAPPRPSHAPGARRPARRVRAGEHGNGGGQRQGACLGAVPRGRCLCHDGGGTPPDSLPQWSEQVKAQKAELDVLRGIATQEDWACIRQVVAEVHDIDARLDTFMQLLRRDGRFTHVTSLQPANLAGSNLHVVYATR